MDTSGSVFPCLQDLTHGLASALSLGGLIRGEVAVVAREPNIYSSTSPSEIVTCRLDDGSRLRLLCKSALNHHRRGPDHRTGVPYEATVYDHVLRPSRTSAPTCYGVYTDTAADVSCLILEYLEGGMWINHAPEGSRSMELAARWIGQFHAANERRLQHTPLPFLRGYDAGYFRGWARRTALRAADPPHGPPWLPRLCQAFEELTALLLAAPPTIIHGEYYPKNILYREGTIYPVDWESAAIAAGEIDLASLTEGWPAAIAQRCEREYQQARWPQGAPAAFARTLEAARLYWCFRWLSDRTMASEFPRYLTQLRCISQRLELMELSEKPHNAIAASQADV